MSDRLPEPPSSLPVLRAGDTRTIVGGTRLYRIYDRSGTFPTRPDRLRNWGPAPVARFDHHAPPARDHVGPAGIVAGTAYYAIASTSPSLPRAGDLLAVDSPIVTAVAEAFQATRIVDCSDRKGLAILTTMAPLEVLDLSSGWATRVGAGTHLSTGPYPVTRRWARAIHVAYPDVVGMTWISSVHPAGRALVLNERAADPSGLVTTGLSLDRSLADGMSTKLMKAAAELVGYSIV